MRKKNIIQSLVGEEMEIESKNAFKKYLLDASYYLMKKVTDVIPIR